MDIDILYETVGYQIRTLLFVSLTATVWCFCRFLIGNKKVKRAKQSIEKAKNKKERRERYSEYRNAARYKKDTFKFIIAFSIALLLTIPGTIEYALDYKNNDLITEELYVTGVDIPKHERGYRYHINYVTYRLTNADGETKTYITRLKLLNMLQMEVGKKYMVTYWKRTRALYSREEIDPDKLTGAGMTFNREMDALKNALLSRYQHLECRC